MLCLFSETLRNDSDLAHFTLRTLRHLRRSPREQTFVCPKLSNDAVFCVKAAEAGILDRSTALEWRDVTRQIEQP